MYSLVIHLLVAGLFYSLIPKLIRSAPRREADIPESIPDETISPL